MDLIVTAHKKEAISFIDNLNLIKNESSAINCYSNKKIVLLVCGQGINNVKDNLTGYLIKNAENTNKIINYGIAGRLTGNILLNSIYQISNVSLFQNGVLENRYTLECRRNITNCITVMAPVSNYVYAESLSNWAEIVDMELAEIAKIAVSFNIPVWSYKLISDDARFPISLKEIKSKSLQLSQQLFNSYNNEFIRGNKG